VTLKLEPSPSIADGTVSGNTPLEPEGASMIHSAGGLVIV
jgi:hypothetical protein